MKASKDSESHLSRVRSPNWLLIILAVSFLLRLGMWVFILKSDPERFQWPDSKAYKDSAELLLTQGNFNISSEFPDLPQTLRTPGYPVFLAANYFLFGPYDAAVAATQMLPALSTIILIFTLAKRLWDLPTANLAALLFFLDATSFAYSFKVLSDTLFTFLLLALVYCLVRLKQDGGGTKWVLSAGIFLALATLVRPLSYYLILPLTLGIIWWHIRTHLKWNRILISAVLFLLPFLLLVGGWQWRNYKLTGSAVYTASEGYNLLFFHGSNIVAARDGITFDSAASILGMFPRVERYRQLHLETRGWSIERLSSRWSNEGLGLILHNPWIFVRNYFKGMVKVWTRPGITRLWGLFGEDDRRMISLNQAAVKPLLFLSLILSCIYLLAVYAGCLYWLWNSISFQRFRLEVMLLLGILLYLALLSAGPPVYNEPSRYRLPMMPLLALLAAAGFRAWWLRSRHVIGKSAQSALYSRKNA
jgi:4-amino-4-deoxy-L-arabinose transferase-like glycosyltransferase